MASKRGLHARLLLVFALALGACSSGGGGGCTGCLKPLPQPYDGPKTNNAVTARVSGDGFDFINQNWQTLLTQFTTNPIHIPVPCMTQNVSVVGDVLICDQDFSGSCDPGEGCDGVYVTIDNFQLTPDNGGSSTQGKVTGSATLDIVTGDIAVRSASDSFAACLGLSDVECNISFDSSRSHGPYTFSMDVEFTLDPRLDSQHPLLAFDVDNIQGLDAIDSGDLNFAGNNTCGNVWCGLGNLGFIKDFIVNQLKPTLEQKVKDTIAQKRCRSCAAGTQACPTGSSCDSNQICQVTAGGGCVPLFLGMEGNIAPGDSLGKYGVPQSANMDVSVAAGGSVSSDAVTNPHTGGLTLGVIGGVASRAGTAPSYLAPCVPDLPGPVGDAPPVPDFDAAGAGTGYHVGLGVSSYFLNEGAYQAHRSGTMCIALSGDQIQLLNTGLFKTFLPSLGLVAGTATQDAPMMVTLRPLATPTIAVGAGTYDPQTLKPIDPLLTLTLNNLLIDIYALIEDRWVRLFSLQVDVQLPLSLIVDGCPQGVTPALGDLKQLIAVSKPPFNSEILAEDPAVLAGLIPAVISLAQPALANALKPIAIPDFNGFSLHIDALKGIGVLSGTEYDNLGVLGELRLSGQACDAATLRTTAQLVDARIPSLAQLHPAPGQALPWPVAIIKAGSTDPSAEAEFGYRVDDGLWSTFLRGPLLEVTDPRFLIQGHHTIQVRARPAGGKGVADPNPVSVDFLVDYEAPEVHAVRHAAENTLEVTAKDNVSGPQRLEYRYQVGDENFSDFGPKREVDLAAVDAAGKLAIEVRDEAGNIGRTVYRAPVAAPTAGLQPVPGSIEEEQKAHGRGCASTDGLALLSLAPVALGLLRRRRRS